MLIIIIIRHYLFEHLPHLGKILADSIIHYIAWNNFLSELSVNTKLPLQRHLRFPLISWREVYDQSRFLSRRKLRSFSIITSFRYLFNAFLSWLSFWFYFELSSFILCLILCLWVCHLQAEWPWEGYSTSRAPLS